ncbi:ATP-binding protein [Streptomyces tanashiensis]|uniref:ATP-binding protein n=1 Tax=Streptomyces tanashiensis TaxID=67367 RepID=UPI0016739C22|nr:LuxR family transcriptional regulator [Streptomyces tanashiensis]
MSTESETAQHGYPMVGRERELSLLASVLSRPTAVVFVEGEAGIGKTRLVQEATRALRDRGVRVLVGRCHPLQEPILFGPVLEALPAAAEWLPDVARLSPQTGALAPLLPGWADRLPPEPHPSADPRAARLRIRGGLRNLLEALSPAVLVVEDMHWADETTRELLLWLARDPPPGLNLVLTYRGEDLPRATPVLGAPYRRPPGTDGAEIRLDVLTERDVCDLVGAALGARATARLARSLHERSAGLPLVVDEDLLSLTGRLAERRTQDEEADALDALALLESAEVPRALQEAVHMRMARLSEPAIALVQAAAVLSVPSDFPTLAETAAMDLDQATAALAETVRSALLCETGPALYGFRHALARQAVYRDIIGPVRDGLHRRAHRILEAQPTPPLVRIAHHTRALGDVRRWLREAEAAAGQALTLGDDGVAIALSHEILMQPDVSPDVRSRVALNLGRIAEHSVDYAPGATALRRIVEDPALDPEARGEVRLALGLFLIDQRSDEHGYAELERAVDELRNRPDLSVRAMTFLARGEPHVPRASAMAWMRRAERAALEVPSALARSAVHATSLALMALDGDPEAWDLVDQLPREVEDREVMGHHLRALKSVGVAAVERGFDGRGTRLLEECRVLSSRSGFRTTECHSRVALLTLDWLGGRWDGLEERFRVIGAEAPDMVPVTRAAAGIRGSLAAARGQWARALQEFRRMASMGGQCTGAGEVVSAVSGIAQVHLAQGDAEAAWAVVAPVLDPPPAAPRAWADGLLLVAVRAALECGRREAAERVVDAVEEDTRGTDSPAVAAVFALTRGMLLRQDGDLEGAKLHFGRARSVYEDMRRPYAAANAAELLSEVMGARDREAAVGELAQAADMYAALGATADTARCEGKLRDLGLRRASSPGRRGYGLDLSPREQQVAHLLADGAANQDIARALVLSVRTVEHHVARTLKKLGVTREVLRRTDVLVRPDRFQRSYDG